MQLDRAKEPKKPSTRLFFPFATEFCILIEWCSLKRRAHLKYQTNLIMWFRSNVRASKDDILKRVNSCINKQRLLLANVWFGLTLFGTHFNWSQLISTDLLSKSIGAGFKINWLLVYLFLNEITRALTNSKAIKARAWIRRFDKSTSVYLSQTNSILVVFVQFACIWPMQLSRW